MQKVGDFVLQALKAIGKALAAPFVTLAATTKLIFQKIKPDVKEKDFTTEVPKN